MESQMETNGGAAESSTAINDLKDSAVLLSLAPEYLCKEVFLRKIGSGIEQSIGILKDHLHALKGQFVGKLVREVDLEKPFEDLSRFADRLQHPDKEMANRCLEGDIGQVLGEKNRALVRAIEGVKSKVEGRPISYEASDVVLNFRSRVKQTLQRFAKPTHLLAKIIGLVSVLCLLAFSYLYFTMETEKEFLKKVDEYKTQIEVKRTTLARINERVRQIKEKMERMHQRPQLELTRQEKIELMDLNLTFHKMVEEKERIQLEVETTEKVLDKNVNKMEEVRRKPFLKKLLRY